MSVKTLRDIWSAALSFISQGSRRMKNVFPLYNHPDLYNRDESSEFHDCLEKVWSPEQEPKVKEPNDENEMETQKEKTQGDMFLFLQLLGRGAFGSVHKLRDEDSKEVFAYKLSGTEKTSNEDMFHKEVRALRQLEGHSNIVQYVCCDIYSKEAGILMEFIEHNVRELLILREKNLIHLEASWIKSIVKELLTAVSYIHSNGIIHFDLKPENLLISRSGVLKVADFGLSEHRNDRPFRSMKATQPYRSPECYLNRSLMDHKTDLWSCGVIILELVTGKRLVPTCRERQDRLRHLASVYGLPGYPCKVLSKALREKNSPVPRLASALQHSKFASAASLAQALLRCNPKERIEAETALLFSFYFVEKPQATLPDLACLQMHHFLSKKKSTVK